MSKIKSIIAREILDSRGKPTVEAIVETDKGEFLASVPSGASTGSNEALELRDADGRGVQTAIKNIEEIIAPKLKGKDVINQKEIDDLMLDLDGTENKSKLGANAILAVSMAVCRAGATAKKIPLYKHIAELAGNKEKLFAPLPMFNILNGGAHAENDLDIQEFMVVPHKKTMQENLVVCNEIFLKLKQELEEQFCLPAGRQGKEHLGLGDEGGFAAPISSAERALIFLRGASEGQSDVKFALDCAASGFYKNDKYFFEGQEMTKNQLLDFYENLVKEFPIIFIEDPFSEDDWQGWQEISNSQFIISNKIFIVGDDLTTTNIKRIKTAHNKKACNGVILKINQIGTISETIEACKLAKSFNWKTIASHRSGETTDDFIADLAVGLSTDFIKAGSPAKEERMVKYRRVADIEKEL